MKKKNKASTKKKEDKLVEIKKGESAWLVLTMQLSTFLFI